MLLLVMLQSFKLANEVILACPLSTHEIRWYLRWRLLGLLLPSLL
jgi:hypothetical protein